ncbi:MAG: hypothetical protein ACLQUZ_01705 [Rhizomicrobium sp.]
MGDTFIISGLREKRSAVAGRIVDLRREVDQHQAGSKTRQCFHNDLECPKQLGAMNGERRAEGYHAAATHFEAEALFQRPVSFVGRVRICGKGRRPLCSPPCNEGAQSWLASDAIFSPVSLRM